ncbi:phage major capsid protein [Paeniclostridium sordellii]|uniref:phage major capsid protein n=2 Tax=Paraclostridium sordellii TaxID=1505 RepID=UPI0005E95CBC|nr:MULTISPECIES: phage major capsid protein [Paeniclostridium]MBW4863285.1 phage major capsid protein [Paeniclostridium sp.]MBW4875039.1 phage major capsid protein [Paeniclostridium sp.]MDU4413053.1 phage major capsid protein [Paeniclostridium sordellii]MVO74133.1 phage major capsid protein [Paeniclostridium sordellii]CEP92044.1 phage protein [[Clostridium] sordellii] [Paeniclostridium sordellii]
MSKELLELMNKIKAQKELVKNLVNENKIDEAKVAKEELKNLSDKFDLLYDLEAEADEAAKENIKNKAKKTEISNSKKESNAFVNAIKARLTESNISDEDKTILNQMSEGSPADGGLTVPKDMRTEIKELRRGEDSLEELVNVEPVTTLSGSRVIEVSAEETPFDNIDEAADFPDVETPKFKNIEYKVKKKGGTLKVTRELIQDSSENIKAYLKRWIAKKSKVTRNFLILKKADEMTKGKEKDVATLDDLKDIFNVSLDPAIALTSKVITNQDGYNFLDKLKDSDGKYILQPDPTQPTRKLLFGTYPIRKLSNKTLKTTENKAPIYCGDFKEAITLFDRETLSVEMNTQGDSYWNKDLAGIKVRERLDINDVDSEAIVKGVITITSGKAK